MMVKSSIDFFYFEELLPPSAKKICSKRLTLPGILADSSEGAIIEFQNKKSRPPFTIII